MNEQVSIQDNAKKLASKLQSAMPDENEIGKQEFNSEFHH